MHLSSSSLARRRDRVLLYPNEILPDDALGHVRAILSEEKGAYRLVTQTPERRSGIVKQRKRSVKLEMIRRRPQLDR